MGGGTLRRRCCDAASAVTPTERSRPCAGGLRMWWLAEMRRTRWCSLRRWGCDGMRASTMLLILSRVSRLSLVRGTENEAYGAVRLFDIPTHIKQPIGLRVRSRAKSKQPLKRCRTRRCSKTHLRKQRHGRTNVSSANNNIVFPYKRVSRHLRPVKLLSFFCDVVACLRQQALK